LTQRGDWGEDDDHHTGETSYQSSHKLQPLLELYFVACLMERTWRFCLPVVLAKAGAAGYKAVAVLCFTSPLAVLLFAPFIGQTLDESLRSGLFVWGLLFAQVMSIVMSGILLSTAFWTGISIVDGWVFWLLLVLQMVEKLSAVTSEVAIERDWITRICGKGNTSGLAHGNSMIRRFDLACDFLGTVGVGLMIDKIGVGFAVWYCVLMSVLSWPVINNRLRLLNIDDHIEVKGEENERKQRSMVRGYLATIPLEGSLTLLSPFSDTIEQDIKQQILSETKKAPTPTARSTIQTYFLDNPMLFSSLVVVLMYFNVALSPGGILSAYLIHRDISGTGLAMFRGACALMGFLGSIVGKALITSRGLLSAGRISLTFVVATLGLSLLVRIESVFLFAALISASRIGIWAFDNVNAQLFQQGTNSSEQSGLAATEAALCSAAEIMMFGLVVGRGKEVAVEWFGWLGFLGWTMVVGGWIGFFSFSWNKEGNFSKELV
jgi:hypothetical protein